MTEGREQISVVITLDTSNASPARAFDSILAVHGDVSDVHLVLSGEADQNAVLAHPRVHELVAQLSKSVALVWHPGQLDIQALQTQALVHVQPDHVFLGSALYALKKDLRRYSGCTHFTFLSGLDLSACQVGFPTWWWWYGFLVPLLVVDMLASWVTLNQHARTVDLRAQLVYRTWPNRNRAPGHPSWWRWWFGTRTCWTRNGTSVCSQAPLEREDAGLAFVLRTVKQHAHCTLWKPWWLALYAAHYLFVAILCGAGVFGAWLDVRIVGTAYAFLVALVAYGIWSRTIRFPYSGEVVALVLYPLYLLVSPLVFLYGRWHTSQATLESALKKKQEK